MTEKKVITIFGKPVSVGDVVTEEMLAGMEYTVSTLERMLAERAAMGTDYYRLLLSKPVAPPQPDEPPNLPKVDLARCTQLDSSRTRRCVRDSLHLGGHWFNAAERPESCPRCDGLGSLPVPGGSGHMDCSNCHGTGAVKNKPGLRGWQVEP